MRKFLLGMLSVCISASVAGAQSKGSDREELKEVRRAALEEVRTIKRMSRTVDLFAPAPTVPVFDPDSFGKTVSFLGSLYAGTVYIDDLGPGPFNANGCPTTPPNNWAPDDHCFQKTPGTPLPVTVPPAPPIITVFDPAWEVTIPGNAIKNVVYPMLNNTVQIFRDGGAFLGSDTYIYVPVVTVASSALDDVVLDGVPLNGSFTTSMTGSKSETRGNPGLSQPFQTESHSYASVAGRGISRDFWRAVGLSNSVINDIYKKPMTLKFGIRFRLGTKPDGGVMFYTFRLLGQ